MRLGQDIFIGLHAATVNAFIKNVGLGETLNALRRGTLNMQGVNTPTAVLRIKEGIMRIAVRPIFVDAPVELFSLISVLACEKRSPDTNDPISFKAKAMMAFLVGMFSGLPKHVVRAIIIDSFIEYNEILGNMDEQSVKDTERFLECEGWGDPVPLNRKCASYFREALRYVAISLWSEPEWNELSRELKELRLLDFNVPDWLPKPKERTRKEAKVVKAVEVKAVEKETEVSDKVVVGSAIPTVGRADLSTQETFQDYAAVLESVAKGRPVLIADHRAHGRCLLFCSVRYNNSDNKEVNINASVREGTIPIAMHVPSLDKAIRRFDTSFEYGNDKNARLSIRMFSAKETASGTTWVNVNRNSDIPKWSFWYRVEGGKVYYNPRDAGPVKTYEDHRVAKVKFPC